MTTIKLYDGCMGSDTMLVRCDLSQAAAPIEISVDGREWEPTQYQCADARHTTNGLVRIAKDVAAQQVEMARDEFDCEWIEA